MQMKFLAARNFGFLALPLFQLPSILTSDLCPLPLRRTFVRMLK
jgi:hypothetical protein